MHTNVESTLRIRAVNASVEDAYSESEQRRRKARTAAVNAELEKEFGPANRVMQDPADAAIRILSQPKRWLA